MLLRWVSDTGKFGLLTGLIIKVNHLTEIEKLHRTEIEKADVASVSPSSKL